MLVRSSVFAAYRCSVQPIRILVLDTCPVRQIAQEYDAISQTHLSFSLSPLKLVKKINGGDTCEEDEEKIQRKGKIQ